MSTLQTLEKESVRMAILILHSPDGLEEFPVEGVMTMGRQTDNAMRLKEGKASRYHSRVLKSGQDFLIEDLGSSNGTKVNGKKIKRCVLRHGDTIQIGKTRIQFEDKDSSNKPVPARGVQKDSMIGITLDNYKIISKLGQGGMGAVYKAEQISMERLVALKILKKEFLKNRNFVKGFLQEARTAGKLTHPGLVQVHDFGESNGILYFSMELIDGEAINAKLKREGKLSMLDALHVGLGVAAALEYANKRNIVHRDVKPHNIMLDKQNNVKLADLGLAAIMGPNKKRDRKSGPIMGTPHYMPPEQSQKEEVDGRTDLYALGCTLFQMVTGRVPFEGPNSLVILTKHITEERPDPRDLNITVPDELAELIMQMMATSKDKRPGNPGEVIYRLKAIQNRELTMKDERKERRKLGSGIVKKRATLTSPDFSRARPVVAGRPVVDRTQEAAAGIAVSKSPAGGGRSPSSPRPLEAVGAMDKATKQSLLNFGLLAVFLLGGYWMLKSLFTEVTTEKRPRPRNTRRAPVKRNDPVNPEVSSGGSKQTPIKVKNTPREVKRKPPPVETVKDPVVASASGADLGLLQNALDKRDRAMQSSNFAGARNILKAFHEKHGSGKIGNLAFKELQETERLIRDALGQMFKEAKDAADKREYRQAVAKCTRLISADPTGVLARNARAMLNKIDSITQPDYQQTLVTAKEQLKRARLDDAIQTVGTGLNDLGGTKWAEPLSAYQYRLILAGKFLRESEQLREAQVAKGKVIKINAADLNGNKAPGTLEKINGLMFKAKVKNVTLPYKFSELSANDLYQMIESLGPLKDHLGFSNLLLLLEHGEAAQKELKQALKVPAQAKEASKLASGVKGVSKSHLYDFSKWQHQGDWEAPEGAWATKNDQYVLESQEGGDTSLKTDSIGGPFPLSGAHVSFDFELSNPAEGYYLEAVLGEKQRTISVVFSAEGLKLAANANKKVSAKASWKPGSNATRVDLKIVGDTVHLIVDGKEVKKITASGVRSLRGTIGFHVRESACAFDNIVLRKGK